MGLGGRRSGRESKNTVELSWGPLGRYIELTPQLKSVSQSAQAPGMAWPGVSNGAAAPRTPATA